jgi:hypothetical protein
MLVDRPTIFEKSTRFQKRLALDVRHVHSIAYMHITKCCLSSIATIWFSLLDVATSYNKSLIEEQDSRNR